MGLDENRREDGASLRVMIAAWKSPLVDRSWMDLRLPPRPYPGLRYFRQSERSFLFGRERQIDDIVDRLKVNRVIAVLGGSGSGKSSLIRAGVVPRLRGLSPIPDRLGRWYVATMRPETRAIDRLAEALWDEIFGLRDLKASEPDRWRRAQDAVFGNGDENELASRDQIAQDVKGSAYAVAGALSERVDRLDRNVSDGLRAGPPNLLIVVDQFEEIFRGQPDTDPQKRARQADSLIRLIEGLFDLGLPKEHEVGIYLAIVMRSEDLHHCAEASDLPEIINESAYLVDWLDPAGLRAAVVGPAREVFLSWGIPVAQNQPAYPFELDVVERLVGQAEVLQTALEHKSDHLPLLQHGLQVLWNVALQRWHDELLVANARADILPTINLSDLANAFRPAVDVAGSEMVGLQHCLNRVAGDLFEIAQAEYEKVGGSSVPLLANEALEFAFRLLAGRDENGRYYRSFLLDRDMALMRLGRPDSRVEGALASALTVFEEHGLLARTASGWDVSHEALIRNWRRLRRWVDNSEITASALQQFRRFGTVRDDQWPVLGRVFGRERDSNYPKGWIEAVFFGRIDDRTGVDLIEEKTKRATEIANLRQKYRRSVLRQDFRRLLPLMASLAILAAAGLLWLVVSAKQQTRETEVRNRVMEVYARASQVLSNESGRQEASVRAAQLRSAYNEWNKFVEPRLGYLETEAGENAVALARRALDSATRELIGGTAVVSEVVAPTQGVGPRVPVYCRQVGQPSIALERPTRNGLRRLVLAASPVKVQGGSFNRTEDPDPGSPTVVLFVSSMDHEWREAGELQVPLGNGTRACLSDEGHVLAVSTPGTPVPTLYVVEWHTSPAGTVAIARALPPLFVPRTGTVSSNDVPLITAVSREPDSGAYWVIFVVAGHQIRASFDLGALSPTEWEGVSPVGENDWTTCKPPDPSDPRSQLVAGQTLYCVLRGITWNGPKGESVKFEIKIEKSDRLLPNGDRALSNSISLIVQKEGSLGGLLPRARVGHESTSEIVAAAVVSNKSQPRLILRDAAGQIWWLDLLQLEQATNRLARFPNNEGPVPISDVCLMLGCD